MDVAERALLEETIRGAIASAQANPERDAVLDDVLADVGWLEMLEAAPRDAVQIVFTALGTANANASVLDDVVVSALGFEPRADLAVVLPTFAAWDAPGQIDGGRVHAQGLATVRAATASEMMIVCNEGAALAVVTVPTTLAEVTAVQGIDPDARLHVVSFEGETGDYERVDAAVWESTVAAGRRAVAHQMAGASRAMLDLARAHAVERVQFGRPISRFQAVRHRLAETLVAIEALEATVDAAWDEPSPLTAALAKAVAGRTARSVTTHCQQVLAGIGFTTDHPFHRFLKRTIALEGLFGSADEIVVDVGRQLLAARTVPTLIEL